MLEHFIRNVQVTEGVNNNTILGSEHHVQCCNMHTILSTTSVLDTTLSCATEIRQMNMIVTIFIYLNKVFYSKFI